MTAPTSPPMPIAFGPPGRRLFGMLHAPADDGVSGHAVVLCNAFGQEAVRAHRLLRVLAERLARAGHPVLRFDYHGTGDSPGDDHDADLDGWAEDVRTADRELRARSGADASVWVGMRLGATIALRAASAAPDALRRLLLWDVVLDGARYLDHLRQRHVDSLEAAFSVPPRPLPSELARDPGRWRDEAIGFALPVRLRDQLAGVHPDALAWPEAPPSIVAVVDPDGEEAAALARGAARLASASRLRRVDLRHGVDWTTDVAGDSALVPAAALSTLAQHAAAPP